MVGVCVECLDCVVVCGVGDEVCVVLGVLVYFVLLIDVFL